MKMTVLIKKKIKDISDIDVIDNFKLNPKSIQTITPVNRCLRCGYKEMSTWSERKMAKKKCWKCGRKLQIDVVIYPPNYNHE